MRQLATFEQAAEMLRYDSETGILYWIKRPCHNVFVGDIAGTKTKSGYVQLSLHKRLYKAHRIVWLLHYKHWPETIIDHINGNGFDNRIKNLRSATVSMNAQNQRKAMKTNATGLLGVSPIKGKRKAEILVSGKKKYLGTFDSPETDHMAYIEEKRKSHYGCTL